MEIALPLYSAFGGEFPLRGDMGTPFSPGRCGFPHFGGKCPEGTKGGSIALLSDPERGRGERTLGRVHKGITIDIVVNWLE